MTVYCSDLLKQKYSLTYASLREALRSRSIPCETLPGTKDVWCRDYLPVKGANGPMVQFRYFPTYLRDSEHRGKITTFDCYQHLSFAKKVITSEIILDGGAIEVCGKKAIITETVLEDNPHYPREELTSCLKELLCLDELIVVPKEPDDDLGHLDGMVRFIDENHVLLNDYGSCYGLVGFGRKLQKIFEKRNFSTTSMPFFPKSERGPDGLYKATGVYTNFLKLDDLVLAPAYGIPEDSVAHDVLVNIFPGNEIIAVNCVGPAEDGGSLHCVTWEDE